MLAVEILEIFIKWESILDGGQNCNQVCKQNLFTLQNFVQKQAYISHKFF